MEMDCSGYEVLAPEECLRLLAGGHSGRLAIHIGALPTIIPVGFALVDGAIVLGVIDDDWLRAATEDAVVAFEVDDVDLASGARWSVVVVGVAARLSTAAANDARNLGGKLGPWSDPSERRLFGLTVHMLSGRRSNQSFTLAEERKRPAVETGAYSRGT